MESGLIRAESDIREGKDRTGKWIKKKANVSGVSGVLLHIYNLCPLSVSGPSASTEPTFSIGIIISCDVFVHCKTT